MTSIPVLLARLAPYVAWLALLLALSTSGAVIAERASFALQQARRRRFESHYRPIVQRALGGEAEAVRQLAASPVRDRLGIGSLLVTPLVDDRDPARIARTRDIVEAMSLVADADALLASRRWWRRAIGLRALGLLRITDRTARVVAALDDWHPEVRAAALDALADLRDPASLPAVVVRLHDTTLHRGRRLAALAAFGTEAEPLVLAFAEVDLGHRARYALALSLCGTEASRPTLGRWTGDGRADVRAAAFEALAHVGLDSYAAQLAVASLEDGDTAVRAAAARALHGWTGPGDAVPPLARHLDDSWPVAIRAARSLQSIVPAGVDALRACADRAGLAGVLARQMLWETRV